MTPDPMPLAVWSCPPMAQALYRSALYPLVDPADGRIVGLRRELYRTMAKMAGVVVCGCRARLMQFEEIDKCLAELVGAGVIEDASVGEVVEIRVVPCA